MAKKHEFRPDKPRTSLLQRLLLTRQQQKTVLKWTLYAVLLLVISVVQDVLMSPVRIFGATTELVPCTIFLICLLEGSHPSSIFALVASLLYLFSGTAPGPYSMVAITFLGITASMIRQAFLQESFFAALLCCAVAMALYELFNFAFGLFLALTPFSRIHAFLITAAISLLAVPVLYPILKAISTIGGPSWKE